MDVHPDAIVDVGENGWMGWDGMGSVGFRVGLGSPSPHVGGQTFACGWGKQTGTRREEEGDMKAVMALV